MILLDTHVLIWWVEDRGRLSETALDAMVASSPLLLSPISFWEVAVLTERRRIELDRGIERWVRDVLVREGTGVADLTPAAAVLAARLPDFYGDPADRFIYATAKHRQIPLLSKDSRMREYARLKGDIEVIW